MSGRIKAAIIPQTLEWARLAGGFTPKDVAKKMGRSFTPERIRAWETGSDRPTISQIEKLATIYDRSAGIFYLPNPPADPTVPVDFRLGIALALAKPSPALLKLIRKAHSFREAAVDLAESVGELAEQFPPVPVRASLDQDPETVAAKVRTWLGVDLPTQRGWGSSEAAFSHWRESLEQRGVLVFVSLRDVPATELRGFAIANEQAPVIVINNKDRTNSRILSLFHELGHIVLRQDALCLDLEDESDHESEVSRVERWCNHFAGAVLVPAKDVAKRTDLDQLRDAALAVTDGVAAFTDTHLNRMARDFSVSPEVVVRRLAILGYLRSRDYLTWRRNWYVRHPIPPPKKTEKGPGYYQMTMYRLGMGYLRLAFAAYWNDTVTLYDLCGYTGTRKVETVQKLEDRFRRRLFSAAG